MFQNFITDMRVISWGIAVSVTGKSYAVMVTARLAYVYEIVDGELMPSALAKIFLTGYAGTVFKRDKVGMITFLLSSGAATPDDLNEKVLSKEFYNKTLRDNPSRARIVMARGGEWRGNKKR